MLCVIVLTYLMLYPCGAFHFISPYLSRGLSLITLRMSDNCFTSNGEDSTQEFIDLFESSIKRETFVGLRFSSRKVPKKLINLTL